MRLPDFITSNLEPILREWESFARSTNPGAGMDSLALRDHAEEILLATVQQMHALHAPPAAHKPPPPAADAVPLADASELHALGRLGSGFNLMDVVSEYRSLRASVLRLWRESGHRLHETDVDDVTFFNQSIDLSLARAVSSYTQRVDQSRDLFLAILSHDLRNPLNSIAVSAAGIPHMIDTAAESEQTAAQIAISVSLMARMIGDLLDYTRTRLGAGMPVLPVPCDVGEICNEIFLEYRTGFPGRDIALTRSGDLAGNFDPDRLRQAVSNVLGNALQHGAHDVPILVSVTGAPSEIVIVVHNGGKPIPPGELAKIFEPLVRGSSAGHPAVNRPGSIGLGLYIAREVVLSHGGTVEVASTEADGTAFTLRLPRHWLTHTGPPVLDSADITAM
jgi:signal transduction histidine kinase